jgi:hypothetical protein
MILSSTQSISRIFFARYKIRRARESRTPVLRAVGKRLLGRLGWLLQEA